MNYKLNETKMFADIAEGFAIVINSETGVYYGMNPFTSSIFDNLLKGVSTESILQDVLSMEGAPAEFKGQLDAFIQGLLDKELIIEGEMGPESKVDAELAQTCHFEISWDEFKDAQELLLADPIHEVREEDGWTPETDSLNPDQEDVARREAKMNK